MAETLYRLRCAAEYVRDLGYFPAYISLYGSQNYGLSLEDADYDFKCIVLPSLREIANEENYASRTVDFEGGQIDIKDIRLFARLIEKMNPAYLECLMTENHLVLQDGEYVEAMRLLLPALFRAHGAVFARVCAKLFEEKGKRLCHNSPAQEEKIARYGYDLKQAHHMYRLLVTLRVFERTGEMQLVPPEEEKALLLELKRGTYCLEEIMEMTQTWHAEIRAIEKRIAAAFEKEDNNAVEQLQKLRSTAVYEHCRREVLNHEEFPV